MKRLGHVRALDGIRGVGAISVIACHYFNFDAGGFYSMEVFFALSGFLITTLLLEEHDRTGRIALSSFYRRRASRLLPGLFTVLAVFAIATLASPLALEQIAAGGLYIGNIVSAWFSQSFLKGTPVFPFWTLAEEEQFYFVWPLLLVILLRRRVRESRVAWLIACIFFVLVVHRARLASAGANIDRLYLAPDTHSDALVLGCLLAFLRRGGLRISQPIGWLGLAALVIVSSLFAPGGGWSANMVGPMAIAATLLVGAALEVGFLSRCLALRPLPWVGEISYSLYLWHFFVFWLFDWRSPFLCLALTLMVATLSYYKVERPLRKGLRPWRGKESPAQPASEQVVAVGPPSELDVVTSPAR